MSRCNLFPFLLLAGSFGISSLAYATDDGHLDGVWLSARIKTSIPKAVDFAGAGPFALANRVSVDTGNNCYVQLTWNGPDSFSYDMDSYCLNGDGLWERGEYSGPLYELNDKNQSLASDWTYVYFAQKDREFADFPDDFAYTGYEGTLILTPKINKNDEVKSIKSTSNAGMIYAWDNSLALGGTSKPNGFKLKFVKPDKVPAGAVDCAELEEPPLCDPDEE
ncbi:MAG: hypothetical protein ACU841_14095 [Gammaproteobacteria bacterium]